MNTEQGDFAVLEVKKQQKKTAGTLVVNGKDWCKVYLG